MHYVERKQNARNTRVNMYVILVMTDSRHLKVLEICSDSKIHKNVNGHSRLGMPVLFMTGASVLLRLSGWLEPRGI